MKQIMKLKELISNTYYAIGDKLRSDARPVIKEPSNVKSFSVLNAYIVTAITIMAVNTVEKIITLVSTFDAK